MLLGFSLCFSNSAYCAGDQQKQQEIAARITHWYIGNQRINPRYNPEIEELYVSQIMSFRPSRDCSREDFVLRMLHVLERDREVNCIRDNFARAVFEMIPEIKGGVISAVRQGQEIVFSAPSEATGSSLSPSQQVSHAEEVRLDVGRILHEVNAEQSQGVTSSLLLQKIEAVIKVRGEIKPGKKIAAKEISLITKINSIMSLAEDIGNIDIVHEAILDAIMSADDDCIGYSLIQRLCDIFPEIRGAVDNLLLVAVDSHSFPPTAPAPLLPSISSTPPW